MDSIGAFILGAILNLLFNITAGLINRRVAIRITRWGWLYFLLHASYLLLSMDTVKRNALVLRSHFGDSKLFSYFIVAVIGASLAVLYWAAVNAVYSRIFHSEEQTQPQPNIVVSPKDDDNYTWVEQDQRKVFRESQSRNASPAVIVEFHNELNPPKKIRRASNVLTKIIYYDLGRLSEAQTIVEHRTDEPCWLNELSSSVSFEVDRSHYLVLGVFGTKGPLGNRNFWICDNDKPDETLDQYSCGIGSILRFGITVKLLWGHDYEFEKEEKSELEIRDGKSFELFYITGEMDENNRPIKHSRGLTSLP